MSVAPNGQTMCPCCRFLFDPGKHRCLLDACGHYRCFLCIFKSTPCMLCIETSDNNSNSQHHIVSKEDVNPANNSEPLYNLYEPVPNGNFPTQNVRLITPIIEEDSQLSEDDDEKEDVEPPSVDQAASHIMCHLQQVISGRPLPPPPNHLSVGTDSDGSVADPIYCSISSDEVYTAEKSAASCQTDDSPLYDHPVTRPSLSVSHSADLSEYTRPRMLVAENRLYQRLSYRQSIDDDCITYEPASQNSTESFDKILSLVDDATTTRPVPHGKETRQPRPHSLANRKRLPATEPNPLEIKCSAPFNTDSTALGVISSVEVEWDSYHLPNEVPFIQADPRFVGRSWLLQLLEAHLNEPSLDSRGILISGPAGSGKTAFVYHLMAVSRRASVYGSMTGLQETLASQLSSAKKDSLNSNDSALSGKGDSPCTTMNDISNPSNGTGESRDSGVCASKSPSVDSLCESLLHSLAHRVIATHLCDAGVTATLEPPRFVWSIARQMACCKRLRAYDAAIRSSSQLRAILSLEGCTKDPMYAWKAGIVTPLDDLLKTGTIVGDYFVVLVDSVHEKSVYSTAADSSPLAAFVSSLCSVLPFWLKLVVTSRNSNIFPAGSDWRHISLDPSVESRATKDLEDYTFHRTHSTPVREHIMSLGGRTALERADALSSLRSALVSASGGSFLHLRLVLDSIEKGVLRLKSSSYKSLPQSLHEIFLLIFNRLCQSSAGTLFTSRVQPILDAVAACGQSFGHLSIQQLVAVSGVDSESRVERLLSAGVLVSHRNGDIHFSTPALREWYLHRSKELDPKFTGSMLNGHRLWLEYYIRKEHLTEEEFSLTILHAVSSEKPESTYLSRLRSMKYDVTRLIGSISWVYAPNINLITVALVLGADPDSVCYHEKERPPLISVHARLNHYEVVNVFLSHGASPHSPDINFKTPLSYACSGAHLDIVRLLVKKSAKVDEADDRGITPFVYAAQSGLVKIIDFLRSELLEDISIEMVQEAFIFAAASGHVEVLKDLFNITPVTLRPDINYKSRLKDYVGLTALIIAVEHGHISAVDFLVKNNASLDTLNKDGLPPLLAAVANNHEGLVITLLNARADLEQTDNQNRTCLHIAASSGFYNLVDILLMRGAKIEAVDNERMTPLSLACLKGQLDTAELLLDEGANIHHLDSKELRPVDLAAGAADARIVKMLVIHGADVEASNEGGMRPLERAIMARSPSVVVTLLRCGAKLTPIAWQMASTKPEIILLLLNKLAEDGNIFYKQGRIKDAQQRFHYALKKFPKEEFGDLIRTFRDLKVTLYLNVSRCKRKLNDYTSAIEYANRALCIKPSSYEAFYARARAERANRQPAEALQDLSNAVKLAPDNREIKRLLVRLRNEAALTDRPRPPIETPL